MSKYLLIVIIVLSAMVAALWRQGRSMEERWKNAEANVEAYDTQLSETESANTALLLTVDQLECFKDSILQKLNETRKELGVKDKNLVSAQYIRSSFSRTDTLTLRDTIYRDPSVSIDTVVGDGWYSVRLGLGYPSTIMVNPSFKSEKHVVISMRKETVEPPKRFFLLRWLQRKHKVIHVDVVERNPYVEDEGSRYVEIVK